MDRLRYSFIAHGNMTVWNPLQRLSFAEIAQRLTLSRGGSVLDIGCGRGHWLVNIAELFDVTSAIGVDASPFAASAARIEAANSIAQGRINIIEGNFDPATHSAKSFDLILCIGATQALTNYKLALVEAHRLLRPNAQLLVGEGYWKRTPDPKYLAFLDCDQDTYTTNDGNCRRATEQGYDVVWNYECTDLEWSDYENQYATNVEDYVIANPDDVDNDQMLSTIRTWHEHFLRFGRDTLGFGLYLLAKK